MTGPTDLQRECETFTAHLTGRRASRYVIEHYQSGHAAHPAMQDATGIDRVLVRAAVSGRFAARVADAYARFFSPRGALRRKLVLLLAILETAPDLHADVDTSLEQSWLAAVLGLAWTGVVGATAVLAGLVVFGPIHLTMRGSGGAA